MLLHYLMLWRTTQPLTLLEIPFFNTTPRETIWHCSIMVFSHSLLHGATLGERGSDSPQCYSCIWCNPLQVTGRVTLFLCTCHFSTFQKKKEPIQKWNLVLYFSLLRSLPILSDISTHKATHLWQGTSILTCSMFANPLLHASFHLCWCTEILFYRTSTNTQSIPSLFSVHLYIQSSQCQNIHSGAITHCNMENILDCNIT